MHEIPFLEHRIAVLEGVEEEKLNNAEILSNSLYGILVDRLKLTVVDGPHPHQFGAPGFGGSGSITISESGLFFHSWPEDNFLSIELGTCSKSELLNQFEQELAIQFNPSRLVSDLLVRNRRGLWISRNRVITPAKNIPHAFMIEEEIYGDSTRRIIQKKISFIPNTRVA